MSTEPEMSDAQFSNIFSIMIAGLIVLTIALIFLGMILASGVRKSDVSTTAHDTAVAERVAPAGQITIGEAPAPQAASGGEATEVASGETVYQNNCTACHASGVAGAPVLGEASAWSDRLDKGVETLYKNAIEGFQGEAGVMPPKGGNTSLSDEAVKAAVDHMLEAVQ